MAVFFIDTQSGQAATERQLIAAGVMPAGDVPSRPWFRIQGTRDASTLWYAVMRKHTRGVFIGSLAIRHSDNHASLLADGWEEISVEDLRSNEEPGRLGPADPAPQAM